MPDRVEIGDLAVIPRLLRQLSVTHRGDAQTLMHPARWRAKLCNRYPIDPGSRSQQL